MTVKLLLLLSVCVYFQAADSLIQIYRGDKLAVSRPYFGTLGMYLFYQDSVNQFLRGHIRNQITSMHTLDGDRLATGSSGEIMIWLMGRESCVRTINNAHSDWIRSLHILSSSQLASGSADKTVKIWDMNSGACTRTLIGHIGSVDALQALANQQQLASGSSDSTIRIWQLDSGMCVRMGKL